MLPKLRQSCHGSKPSLGVRLLWGFWWYFLTASFRKGKVTAGVRLFCASYYHRDGTSENSKKTDTPRSFSRAELEDMVRRWDFSEDEQACRDLLISAFPAVIGHVTAEDLESMDTQSLLLEISDKDP